MTSKQVATVERIRLMGYPILGVETPNKTVILTTASKLAVGKALTLRIAESGEISYAAAE